MLHGHPETYDDSGLESGNAKAKAKKKNLFWGGTDEEGATYTYQRSTGKRDEHGELIMKEVTRPANPSIERKLLEETWLDQNFQAARGWTERSAVEAETRRLVSVQFAKQCESTVDVLQKLSTFVCKS